MRSHINWTDPTKEIQQRISPFIQAIMTMEPVQLLQQSHSTEDRGQ